MMNKITNRTTSAFSDYPVNPVNLVYSRSQYLCDGRPM